MIGNENYLAFSLQENRQIGAVVPYNPQDTTFGMFATFLKERKIRIIYEGRDKAYAEKRIEGMRKLRDALPELMDRPLAELFASILPETNPAE